jgi:hypothetical protein
MARVARRVTRKPWHLAVESYYKACTMSVQQILKELPKLTPEERRELNRTINELATSFATLECVEALVLAGSPATGLADEGSDYDLYANTREAVPVEFRAQLLKPRAARLELHNTFWESSDEWVELDGTPLISCTAHATPSKRTWKPSWAEARPRWATQRAFATRCCKPRRCSIRQARHFCPQLERSWATEFHAMLMMLAEGVHRLLLCGEIPGTDRGESLCDIERQPWIIKGGALAS